MLYLFLGPDITRAKEKAHKTAKGCEVVRVGEGGVSIEEGLEALKAVGLFSPQIALICDRLFESGHGETFIETHRDELVLVPAPVFIIEPSLTAAQKKLFPKKTLIEEFETKNVSTSQPPNVFSLTDSFLAGDRKKSWLTYRSLIDAGIPPEEIHGVLSWAVRSTLISLRTETPEEAGLKPFVYNKSKRAGEKMGYEKVAALSRNLSSIYHRSRMGEGSLELFVENALLEG